MFDARFDFKHTESRVCRGANREGPQTAKKKKKGSEGGSERYICPYLSYLLVFSIY